MPARTHLPSLLQFVFSTLAMLLAASLAVLLLVVGFAGANRFAPVETNIQPVNILMFSASLGMVAFLLAPSVWFSFKRLRNPEAPRFQQLRRLPRWVWIVGLALALLAGHFAARSGGSVVMLVLPLAHITAVGCTAAWLYSLGSHAISLGSSQRFGGVLAAGLVLGPLLILVVEMMALAAAIFAAIVYIASDPQMASSLTDLARQLQDIPPDSIEEIRALIEPFLRNPVVIFGTLAFGAGLVPLVEEALKTAGLWLISQKQLSPAQGFVAGLLSGAGYALFESLLLTVDPSVWSVLVLSRIGTSLLHILTGGLIGWGLATAWRGGGFLRLALVYLAAVLLHGLWNGLTLVSAGSTLLAPDVPAVGPQMLASPAASIGLLALVLLMFALLVIINLRLRRSAEEQALALSFSGEVNQTKEF